MANPGLNVYLAYLANVKPQIAYVLPRGVGSDPEDLAALDLDGLRKVGPSQIDADAIVEVDESDAGLFVDAGAVRYLLEA